MEDVSWAETQKIDRQKKKMIIIEVYIRIYRRRKEVKLAVCNG